LPGQYTRKRREKCVVFVDDCFDYEGVTERLLGAGFCQVERFTKHFPREDGAREQGVKDPRVIHLCNRHQWLLLTTDSSICNTHNEEIKLCPDLAILATAHNSAEDPDEWISGFIKAKARVEREFKKRQRPWYGQFSRDGKITTIREVSDEEAREFIAKKKRGTIGP
jgi:hypothetical protein